MLTQTSITGSDDWWLMQCATDMGKNFPRLGNLKKYRDGNAPVPDEASGAMRAAYANFVKQGRLNMAELVVGAKTNRQKPVGFRTAAAGDDVGDLLAWANWKRSHMAVGVRGLFADVGHYGTGYLTVTGSPAVGTGPISGGTVTQPSMIASNGWNTYSSQLATAPWLAEAAITVGFDPILGADVINLFRRGTMRTAVRLTATSTIPKDGSLWNPGTGWDWTSAPITLGYTPECPVVRLDGPDGVGQYEKHLDTMDRINDTIKQRSTIIAMQAFRQRAIKGDMPQVYPDDHELAGQKINYDEIFKAGPAALWLIPEDASIWESAVTDITPILSASKDDLKHLAAVTSTPLYVLSPDAASGSAEGAALAKETLMFAVEDLNDRAGDALATAHALMFQAQRDTVRSDPAEIETIWASIDRVSIVQRAAAAPSAKAGGMSQRMIDEKIFGLTPAEIAQAKQDREDEAFDAPPEPQVTSPFAPAAADVPSEPAEAAPADIAA